MSMPRLDIIDAISKLNTVCPEKIADEMSLSVDVVMNVLHADGWSYAGTYRSGKYRGFSYYIRT